jgi:hypothetical protein
VWRVAGATDRMVLKGSKYVNDQCKEGRELPVLQTDTAPIGD